jgi:hypothetical protein
MNTRGVSFNDSTRASATNHQIVTSWALGASYLTLRNIVTLRFTATVGAANLLYYLHFKIPGCNQLWYVKAVNQTSKYLV